MDNEPTEGPQEGAPATPTAGMYSHFTREIESHAIADRTGELMGNAFELAEKIGRVNVGAIQDPRDGTVAHFQIGRDGAQVIPADAWDEYRRFPLWREGLAVLTQLDSFIALVNRHKLTHTAIFACDNLEAPALTAIFDYHPDNADLTANGPEVAGHQVQAMRHRARYAFPLSVEWQAWFGRNGRQMTMGDFARFLETNIADVSDDPIKAWSDAAQAFAKANRASDSAVATPTRLIDLSRKFAIYETAEACEAVNLTSGETQFTFVSEHKQADGKPVDFPSLFSIVIPLFARSTVYYRLIARLRYRLQSGKPVFWFELWRPDLTFETAFNEALEQVRTATELPIYAGSPEI